ncbi:hypothetical protein EYF80_062348 [Liparis tanakae]|uniref:Uncharacterized protein n=1 Tax=Liparis tanakae TaxID=230148 RepID=A0A4Z2EFI8_9TELE|nr:hypothetical protein EYF80_062348 [Liparis tanakae]
MTDGLRASRGTPLGGSPLLSPSGAEVTTTQRKVLLGVLDETRYQKNPKAGSTGNPLNPKGFSSSMEPSGGFWMKLLEYQKGFLKPLGGFLIEPLGGFLLGGFLIELLGGFLIELLAGFLIEILGGFLIEPLGGFLIEPLNTELCS